MMASNRTVSRVKELKTENDNLRAEPKAAKNGDHYWVLAHVTPSIDVNGNVVGYHSNRRTPRRDAVTAIQGLYRQLLAKESESHSPKDGIAASEAMLMQILQEKGVDYDRFIHAL